MDKTTEKRGARVNIPTARVEDEELHPEFGHMALLWWDETGRMQWQEKGRRCEEDHRHFNEATIRAVLLERTGLPHIPPDTKAWMVSAGAGDAELAKEIAMSAAMSLGSLLNPRFPRGWAGTDG